MDPWAWNAQAQQQDPSLYGWRKSALTADNLGAWGNPLQQAGLWRPEFSQVQTDQYNPGEGGVQAQPYDLSSLEGYTVGEARGPGYNNLRAVFDPQGNIVGRDITQTSQSWKSNDWRDAATTVGGTLAAGYGLSGAGAGAGAGGSSNLVAGSGAGDIFGWLGSSLGSGSMGWESFVGPALQFGGALLQDRSIGKAADAQSAASQAAIDEQRRQFDLTRGDLAPYRAAGLPALSQYADLVNRPTTAADAMADPGYAWAQEQGQQAIDRKAAAQGGRVSGAALKAASRFNAGNASQFFGAADQRRENRLARLAALAGIGQSAVNTSANAGAGMANAIGGYMQNQGDNAGAASIARGNVWGNTANQLAALYGRQKRQDIDPQTGLPTYALDPYGG